MWEGRAPPPPPLLDSESVVIEISTVTLNGQPTKRWWSEILASERDVSEKETPWVGRSATFNQSSLAWLAWVGWYSMLVTIYSNYLKKVWSYTRNNHITTTVKFADKSIAQKIPTVIKTIFVLVFGILLLAYCRYMYQQHLKTGLVT